MERPILKTSEKNFEDFKKYCKEYQSFLELNNFDIYYIHKLLKGKFAQTAINYNGHVAVISLSTEWPDRLIIEEELRKCALHEICHILIIQLSFIATCRYVNDGEIEEADESLTVKLEHLLSKLL